MIGLGLFRELSLLSSRGSEIKTQRPLPHNFISGWLYVILPYDWDRLNLMQSLKNKIE